MQMKQNVAMLEQKLTGLIARLLDAKRYPLITQVQKLNALNPLKVLERGYALVQNEDGNIITSVTQMEINSRLHLRLKDGTVMTAVERISEHP
jgi:exodeoxyribonuclease VII large subunit